MTTFCGTPALTPPRFHALQLAKKKALSAEWVTRIVPGSEICKEQLARAAAHPTISRKGPIQCHLTLLLTSLLVRLSVFQQVEQRFPVVW